MNLVVSENGLWTPTTEEDKVKVRLQMNRLLETSHFKNSKRYPLLFQFIVEETLAGRGEFLKERLLGVRVFDRPADYDTAEDPIVRVTVAEIRKRSPSIITRKPTTRRCVSSCCPAAICRNSSSAERPPLLTGCPPIRRTMASVPTLPIPRMPMAKFPPLSHPSRRSWFLHPVTYALGAMVLLLILLGAGDLWKSTHPPAIDELWKPFLANRRTVLFCLPVGAGTGVAKARRGGNSRSRSRAKRTPGFSRASGTSLLHLSRL